MIRHALATIVVFGATPALAAGVPDLPGSQLQVAMTLYAIGFTLGKMDIDATISGDEYRVAANLETQGLVNALWRSQIQATASGKLTPKTFTPSLYDSLSAGRGDKKQQVSLSYEDGNPHLFAEPLYSTTGYEVKPEDARNTLDPLSAVALIASGVGAREGNPCALTAPIFDGRRRYNIEMTKVRDVEVKMDNGLYQGKAVRCDIRYHQIAGFKPHLLKDEDSFPVIHAWIASFPSDAAGRDYTVPVRVWAETKYGVMAALATSVKVDGRSPKGVQ